uniref:Uncharacterized protein n=1 Tax=Fagus sylvatica TaxID=28930 RepID=A0A2N9G766_FAGSY
MQHIAGKLSTSSFQRYKVCMNRSSDERVMAPGSRGIGAVFVHLSGEDSDQMGDAFGEPRVPRRSWSRYLSNAPGLVDQLVASRKDSAREGGCPGGKMRFPPSAFFFKSCPKATGVFLVRLRAVFRSGFRTRPDKFLAIREFHVVHECVFFPTHPGLWINLLRVRKTLRASVATSVGKVPEIFSTALFRQPVFTRMVDIAPDVGFRQSWYRRKAGATYFPKVQALHRGELGFARYDPANGGRWNVPYAKGFDHNFLVSRPFWARKVSNRSSHYVLQNGQGSGQFDSVFRSGQQSGQTLVKLGQPWSNLVKTLQTPGNVSRNRVSRVFGPDGPQSGWERLGQTLECLMRPGFVGSYGLGPGRPAILRADTRENPCDRTGDGPRYRYLDQTSAKNTTRQSKSQKNQADSFPIRLRFEGWVDQTDSDPNHKFRFETWVDQADSFPVRLRFEGWVDQTDSDPNHKFPFRDLDGLGRFVPNSSPFRGLGGPDRFGPESQISVSRPGWTRPIRSQFVSVSRAGWTRPIRTRITNFVSRPGWTRPIRSQFVSVSRAGWTRPIRTRITNFVSRPGWTRPIRSRFAAWVVPESDHSSTSPNCLFASRPIFSKPWNTHLDSGRTGTQTETNCATAVGERGNRENPSGQKSSHLFFVQRSLCQETPNKEGATVITPFLPPGFSRVSARKTRQPEPSRPVPTRAHHLKYSQKEGPRHISQAYLGGNVCAKILSDPLQLGPRAKTLRQEVHFSYHMQLSDRQELLRSSRNLSQKMTPWHKEHSDGLLFARSYLANPNSPLCKACTVKNSGISHRRCHACAQSLPDSQQVDLRARAHWKEDTSMHDVELSDRQEFIGVSRNPDRKTALKRTKNTPVASVRGAISHKSKLGFPRILEPCKNRQRKLSDGTKNVKIRHRELGQICARTGTRFEKKRAGSKTHFFSRTAAFARRVFPARNKLIREPGCVGKIMTPATSWNSRFADSIPRLIGICIGRVHKNSSDTPTSGSHNSLVRTPICTNFISLERGRRELSDDMPA